MPEIFTRDNKQRSNAQTIRPYRDIEKHLGWCTGEEEKI
jgi:hypothetical protein